MLQVLREFHGLPHRCQTVTEVGGVSYINDSKATNVGATLAAIQGLCHQDSNEKNLVLIAGGQAKGQDFSPFAQALQKAVKCLVLLGEDAKIIDDALVCSGVKGEVNTVYAADLSEAVRLSHDLAESGDVVLLSPACASFDMFSGFVERGEQFVDAVMALGVSR